MAEPSNSNPAGAPTKRAPTRSRFTSIGWIAGLVLGCICGCLIHVLAVETTGVRRADGSESGQMKLFGVPVVVISGPGAKEGIWRWDTGAWYLLGFLGGGLGLLVVLALSRWFRRKASAGEPVASPDWPRE